MAELCVTVADVLGSMAGEEVDTFDQSAKVVKFNDVVLAIGKCVDLAADWVLVAQLQDGTFGPRPLVLVATAICATMGTLVELYAIVVLFRIPLGSPVAPERYVPLARRGSGRAY